MYQFKLHTTYPTVRIVSFITDDMHFAKIIAGLSEGDLYIFNDLNETWELVKSYSED